MTRRYWLLFLLFCLFENDLAGDISRGKITELAQKLCTGQDICYTNTSQRSAIQQTNICCSDCSCNPNCKENEDCCFPDQAYPVGNGDTDDENAKNLTEDEDTTLIYECLYPSSPQPTDILQHIRQQSIWMISEILNKSHLSKHQKCGQRQVAPWGSLLPVSSRKTGHIYKNIECAKDHGVKRRDIMVWKGRYMCKARRGSYFDLGEVYLNECLKRFNAPTGLVIQRSSLCFNNLIDTCPEKDFTIPKDLDMNRSEVIKACTSGLVSPYRLNDMFSNVFCHICHGFLPRGRHRCSNLSVYFGTEKTSNYITALINYNVLQSFARDKGEQREPLLACIDKDIDYKPVADTCRIIRCPIGQSRNSAGECLYSSMQWSNVDFKLWIQLTSEQPFNIHHYFPKVSGSQLVDILQLDISIPKSLKIESIFYKPLVYFNYTDELFIYTSTTNSSVELLNKIKNVLHTNWLLLSQNTTILLKARIANEKIKHPGLEIISGSGTKYHRIYDKKQNMYITNPIYLTKLYFCENVQLIDGEFELSNKGIVYNKISNRSLFNSEFSLFPFEQSTSCRVCLADSGFIASKQKTSLGNSQSLCIFVMCVCSLLSYRMQRE